tara:strand:+ start:4472 stop:4714 length:243 start_codon:yes stop_codon:yes gene_type:complete
MDIRKPLWGYKKTNQGYKDTSTEKYPKTILFLTFIIVIVYGWTIVTYSSTELDILFLVALGYFALKIIRAVYCDKTVKSK